ncbi:MAG: DinB family protein [Sphingobacteriales bacterium]|nr:DinB family protein [Sphingobacteriales bacterium]
MQKSEIQPMPEFFDRYINLVEEDDLFTALENAQKVIENTDMDKLHKIGSKIYAPGKWTINDIYQHIIDNERVQSFRALWIARGDTHDLPGYDEDLFANNARTDNRTIDDIIDELLTVRKSTIQLFKSFEPDALKNVGVCFNRKVPVLGLGYMLVGHQIHHLRVIKERYEPLIQ